MAQPWEPDEAERTIRISQEWRCPGKRHPDYLLPILVGIAILSG
jgi:hypothetical protein